MRIGRTIGWAACAVALCGCASTSPRARAVSTEDVDRFATMLARSGPTPDAATLQRDYLDPGSAALQAFDRETIGGAARLSEVIARQPERWRGVLDRCGTDAARIAAEADAQEVLQAYTRVLPDFAAPPIHLLVGADNSSGMRLPGPRIGIALERMCASVEWRPGFRALLAHELAHAPQPEWSDDDPLRRDLLAWALREGAADYLGALVRGEDPSGAGNTWAMAREAELFAGFHRDRATMRAHWQGAEPDAEAVEAGTRWFWNAASESRPQDLGYWIGQRIWHGYLTRAPDRARALQRLLTLDDPDAVLRESGYAPAAGHAGLDARDSR